MSSDGRGGTSGIRNSLIFSAQRLLFKRTCGYIGYIYIEDIREEAPSASHPALKFSEIQCVCRIFLRCGKQRQGTVIVPLLSTEHGRADAAADGIVHIAPQHYAGSVRPC